MSTTDDARLDALDRRGRAAARTLLDDLATRGSHTRDAGDTPAAATGPAAPAGANDPAGPATSTVIHLGRPNGRGGRSPARRMLLAAAIVAVVTAVGSAVAVATRDDGHPAVSSGGPLDHLLPGWVPPGFEPVLATDIPDIAAAGYSADIAVYGEPDSDDPWSATASVVHLVADEALLGDRSSGEAVTVAGHDARLRESDGLGDGRQWEVEWQVDDGLLIVAGPLTRDEILAVAETATTEPAIDTSGLPGGYAELARGPFMDSPVFMSLFEGSITGAEDGAGPGSGLAVTYADPADSGQVRPAVVVTRRPGPASAVDLVRLWFTDAEATTVRGRHAVIGRGDEPPGSAGESGVVAVQWAEPDGQLVSVVGFGVAEDAVLQVAEGLRPAGPEEVAALREEHAVAAPREFGDVRDGHVVVASGDTPRGQWRVVADAGRQDNIGALAVERLWGAIASTTSTTGDRVEPPVDVQIDSSDGTIVIWGVLWEDAGSLTVEAPGVEPIALDLHEVEGWTHAVVVDAFPDDHFAGTDGTVSVVARDVDGREVGRNDSAIGP